MSSNSQAYLCKCILRYFNGREANGTALGVSLEATAMNESDYIHTTRYIHLC